MPEVPFDSHALLQDRVLSQHQQVLSLIRLFTQNPKIDEILWLDLCCGRGQILQSVEHVIPSERRNKIRYLGIDASLNYAREAERRACELFGKAKVEIIELQNFEMLLSERQDFHVVTLTNSVHEINPRNLGATFVGALCRVKREGFLFVYDMESLPEPELGAIPWRGIEIERIFREVLLSIGAPADSLPDIAVWPHRSCRCWNLQLHRDFIEISSLEDVRDQMLSVAEKIIRELLEQKHFEISRALAVIARDGPSGDLERSQVLALLYDFWAISKALRLDFNKLEL